MTRYTILDDRLRFVVACELHALAPAMLRWAYGPVADTEPLTHRVCISERCQRELAARLATYAAQAHKVTASHVAALREARATDCVAHVTIKVGA